MPDEPLIRFNCPHCGAKAKARAVNAGMTVKCPKCGVQQVVPGTVYMEPEETRLIVDDTERRSTPPPAASLPAQPPDAGRMAPIDGELSSEPIQANLRGFTSSTYHAQDSRFGISHRPQTTFGHSFAASFGCFLGIAAVGFVVLALFCGGCLTLAGLGNALQRDETRGQRGR